MSDRIEIPARAFNDRRVRGSHLRALAALCKAGDGAISIGALSADSGVQARELRRLIQDLSSYGYVDVTERAGQESLYSVIFIDKPRMKITQGENVTQAEKSFAPEPSETLSPDVPLSLPPKPLEPLPPLIPQTPSDSGARATRLPADWQPDRADLEYAHRLGVRDIPAVAEDFRDYWHSRAGPDARKVSWPKTWKRWCRTTVERQSHGQSKRPNGNAKLSHSESIFASFAIALGDGERQADCGADRDLAGPLLDAGDGAGSPRPFEP